MDRDSGSNGNPFSDDGKNLQQYPDLVARDAMLQPIYYNSLDEPDSRNRMENARTLQHTSLYPHGSELHPHGSQYRNHSSQPHYDVSHPHVEAHLLDGKDVHTDKYY